MATRFDAAVVPMSPNSRRRNECAWDRVQSGSCTDTRREHHDVHLPDRPPRHRPAGGTSRDGNRRGGRPGMTAPRLMVFDAIETLFSLDPVRSRLRAAGAPERALDVWFARLLRDAFALTAAGGYAPFRLLAEGALRSVLADDQVPASDDLVDEILATLSSLPIHDDGPPALEAVADAGIPIYLLTNGSRETTEQLLEKAEVVHLIDAVVTVHDAGRWKPAPEPYLHAVQEAGVLPSEAALIAVHGWDICGARSAGLRTGWCSRLEHHLSPALGPADATGPSLVEVVSSLLDSSRLAN